MASLLSRPSLPSGVTVSADVTRLSDRQIVRGGTRAVGPRGTFWCPPALHLGMAARIFRVAVVFDTHDDADMER